MTHALGPARAWKNQFQARIIAAVALFQTQQTRILRLVKQGGRQRAFLRANIHKTQVCLGDRRADKSRAGTPKSFNENQSCLRCVLPREMNALAPV
jgi:hypothetical protein